MDKEVAPKASDDAEKPAIEPLLTIADLSAILKVSSRKIYAMRSTGELPPAIRFGRTHRWRKSDIESWLAKRAATAKRWP